MTFSCHFVCPGDDDSDSEVRRVPEAPGKGASSAVSGSLPRGQSPSVLKRRRNGGSADKENKRLKRYDPIRRAFPCSCAQQP